MKTFKQLREGNRETDEGHYESDEHAHHFNKGIAAYHSGKKLTHNPFLATKHAKHGPYNSWKMGWKQAEYFEHGNNI